MENAPIYNSTMQILRSGFNGRLNTIHFFFYIKQMQHNTLAAMLGELNFSCVQ